MSDITLDSTIHVFEDTTATFTLRDIIVAAGYTPSQSIDVASFLTEMPDGTFVEDNTPLLGLDGGKLTVTPGAWQENYNGQFTTYQFLVADGNGDLITLTLQVVVDPVNDAPFGADHAYNLTDRTPVVLGEDAFGFRDPVEGDHFNSMIITSLPKAGQILLNGEPVAAGTEISIDDIRAGNLTFQPAKDSGGTVEMGFHVRDDGGTVGPGAKDTSEAVNYLKFTVPVPVPVDPGTPGTGGSTPAHIGDTVWEDGNANGIQDSGEAGIAGVTVTLRDTAGNAVATTTTDAAGHYGFDIGSGTYVVAVTAPAGYLVTTKGAGSDAAKDSDFNAAGVSDAITVVKGDVHDSADAGLFRAADISAKVWSDTDRDGKLDAGEAGIGNVKVSLLDAAGKVVASAVTDASGNYQFGDLKPGTYSLKFDPATLPAGAQFVTGAAGSESDADASGATAQVTLASGQHAALQAGAVTPNGTIASTVWHDADGNGLQDGGEKGIANAVVHLLDSTGKEVGVTKTDASGNYSFSQAAGTYTVHVDAPAGYTFTGSNVGTNDAIDSDVNASGNSAQFTVTAGKTIDPADAGLYKTATLGNRVWFDCDGDGIQDSNESGIKGVKVTLLDTNGKAVTSTTTNAAGEYSFAGLKPGTYSVQFDKSALPSGYIITKQNAGTNDAIDSDIDANGLSHKVTLASGEVNNTIDAGVTEAAVIGDRVWLDSNANGIQDSGETGVANVAVTLTDTKGAIVATTTTDKAGNYKFAVTAGTYSVSIKTPDGYAITKQNAGSTATDSNADASGKLGTVTVAAGGSNLTMDAGLVQGASVGNFVWEDSNANGIQDAGEKGLCGVTVKLYDANHKLQGTTVTAADGSYQFGKLAAGTYSIEVARPDGYNVTKANVGNDSLDSDFKLVNGVVSSGTFKLAANEQNTTIDAGLYRTASIGDKVWRDANHNGIQDKGEEGIGKVKVALYTSSGTLVSSTTTDANGNYLFKNLDPGSYYLQFDKTNVVFKDSAGYTYSMNDWKWGVKNTGSNDSIDSDVNGDGVSKVGVTKTDVFTVTSGQSDMTRDAAITPIAIDLNGDGIHTIARADFGGSFDLLGTGSAVKSGWLAADDAFLAIDLNGNGRIDDITELFGGATKGSGFAKLADFDSNGDGFVTAADTNFAKLTLWQDANSNGITDAGELVSLAQAGVTSLTVAYEELPFLDANGNLHLERSSAVVGGQTVDMTDVYFNVAAADAAAAGIDAQSMATLIGQASAAAA
ncbi:SdrD B-like protein [Pseudoduganella lurida]|uniref:SdrD B-like protein n=1 Tax=Pseudoduganella lurida TaxID=1036180 RepID=A0A562RKC2_9BURK|nr:SdrD B-like domain-containing protein [Pseudoduganella lurida]TWI69502.1 SdrD B-like protein [Pseudoduganella lurida]